MMKLEQLIEAAREELESREDEIIRRIVKNTIRQMVTRASRSLMYELDESEREVRLCDLDVTLRNKQQRIN